MECTGIKGKGGMKGKEVNLFPGAYTYDRLITKQFKR